MTTTKYTAEQEWSYDYKAQKWIQDGGAIRREQLLADRAVIAGPEGANYLRFIGSMQTIDSVLADIDLQLAYDPYMPATLIAEDLGFGKVA